ncbi:MAG: hypothetical protein LH614_09825 [Pyrinomonadaceae bacterium]|nr:hypothetical protein [Pyrinomonadaceae bacterium]
MKNFIQWNYKRGTWQYDIFCLLIVAFIFLTPKTWFDKKERLATQTARLIVKAQDISLEKIEMEKRVRELSGNPNAEILGWHERQDSEGSTFYEIDIR